MYFIEEIYEKAKKAHSKIGFPECENEVMMRVAARVAQAGLAQPIVVGNEKELRNLCRNRNIDENLFQFADVENISYREQLAKRYAELPDIMLGEKAIVKRTVDPLCMSLVLEKLGDVSVTFSGFVATTEEVILAGQMIIGLEDYEKPLSSIGFFDARNFNGCQGTLFGFGDSAICVNPTAEELAEIAIECCDNFKRLTDHDPRCALLSYSTDGSGEGESITKVRKAVSIANDKRPELMIDGEFQLDAAINEQIGKKKIKRNSEVAGCANLLIWPDLNSGNIGIKLIQQFAHPECYEAVLQGFKLPIIDVSRGESEQGMFDTVAIASVLAANQ